MPEAGEDLRKCQLGSNLTDFLPGPASQEFEQDKRKRGPGGSDEFLETEEQPQKMPEERLRLGGDVARPTVPKDGKDPWE